jgi:fatty-acid desaturase
MNNNLYLDLYTSIKNVKKILKSILLMKMMKIFIIYLIFFRNKGKKEPKTWDKFTSSTKENISSSDIKFWDKIFVITKLVVCFLLFFFTLGTAVISKICLVIVTANIYPRKDSSPSLNDLKTLSGTLKYTNKETNVQWIWALIMMAGAPYLFSCFKCLWRLLFQMSGRGSPTYQAILGVNVCCF